MSSVTHPLPAPVSEYDRLGLTLFFAVVLHALFILGLRFDILTQPNVPPAMEVTLVTARSSEAPEKPDFLAQANQQGGGDTDEQAAVTTPPPAAQPVPQELREAHQPEPPPAPAKPTHTITAQAPSPDKTEPDKEATPATQAETPSAAELVARSMQIASLSAEINESRVTYAKRPRKTFISAATREYKYASYMEAWRRKVEAIGNLNYPDEARRKNLSGSLILDVALSADGKVSSIALRRSSGHKVLDDAAIAIVKLAAPYAPFPDNIRKETDVLHITRTWQFLRDHRLSSSN